MNNVIDVHSPDIGEGVKVLKILKEKGSLVKKYDTIVVCDGDGVEIEIKSDFDGVIDEILLQKGDEVNKNSVVARIIPSNTERNKSTNNSKKLRKKDTDNDANVIKDIPSDCDDRVLSGGENNQSVEDLQISDIPEDSSTKLDVNTNDSSSDKNFVDTDNEPIFTMDQKSDIRSGNDSSENTEVTENNSSKDDISRHDNENFIEKEEIIDLIKNNSDNGINLSDNLLKTAYRIVPFIKNLFQLSRSENNNLYDFYRYLDLSVISDSINEFSEEYKKTFDVFPKIDPFIIKSANILIKKTEMFKRNKINYIYKSPQITRENFIDNICKKKYHEVQAIVQKDGEIKNSDNILKIIYNYRNGFMKSNNTNCIVLNAMENEKDVIVSYMSSSKSDNGFFETFFRCLENPSWIMFDIMV